MKVKVIGRNRPFWAGKLRKLGDLVDVPKELYEDKGTRSKWMGDPARKSRKVVEATEEAAEMPNVV